MKSILLLWLWCWWMAHLALSRTPEALHRSTTAVYRPPDPTRPCRHPFRLDPEASALLADFVVVGWPTPTFQARPGLLYNASIHVQQVAKRPRYSIFPVRKDFPILAGPFNRRTDLGRCWVNVKFNVRYIFFIEKPNWAGFFRVTQIPLLFTIYRWRKIRNILAKGRE